VFKGLNREFSEAHWMDNGERLSFENDRSARELRLEATGYPYGTNTVVRVARLR
jgi:alpha-L-fucosidase